jgi:hypothetical protein
VEAWALQSLRARQEARRKKAPLPAGEDDCLPFLSTPPSCSLDEEPPLSELRSGERLCYVDLLLSEQVQSSARLLQGALEAQLEAQLAHEGKLLEWEEAERVRQKAAAEARRAREEEEESRATLAKQHAAAAGRVRERKTD